MTLPRLKLPWRWMRLGHGKNPAWVLVCGSHPGLFVEAMLTGTSIESKTRIARRHGALAE